MGLATWKRENTRFPITMFDGYLRQSPSFFHGKITMLDHFSWLNHVKSPLYPDILEAILIRKKVATIQHVWMWLCLWLMDVYGGIGWSNSHHSPGHHISKWTKWDQGTEVEVELVEELLLELLLVLVLVIVVELLLVEVLPKRFVGWSRDWKVSEQELEAYGGWIWDNMG